ncbi:FtsX-like permease family protein [Streptomyces chilikensis]|uniref:FtsX-like permease family protein n=1 Tax=Streptomyces chilikensis TaxID=1194079 RepID=A0ABV3ER73_9ACTN
MTGLVTARIRAHRALLAAAFLTVLLTTSVLAALTAYAGALGDASLRHALGDPAAAAENSLLVRADIGREGQAAADAAVRRAAAETFDGLPATVRPLIRSGSYALPGGRDGDGGRSGGHTAGGPDLTHFAALDPAEVLFTAGRPPAAGAPAGSAPVETALAENAAAALDLSPGDRFTLTDRLGGPSVPVVITGLFRPRDPGAPYWRLDELGGRGAATVDFTTYGPLLTDPAVLTSERVSTGPSSWLVSADFAPLTADRLDALRTASRDGAAALTRSGALGQPEGMGGTTASAVTGLPAALDRIERSLEVSRSTLLTVAAQLAVPAGCALLLTARLLTAERSGETRLLLARGASRRRPAALAGAESLLLTLPAALLAPALAAPLTALMGGQGDLARIGLRPDTSLAALAGRPDVWLASAVTALACAAAMTLPALTGAATAGGRARALPAPLRAGGDLALVALAVVAYLQLRRRSDDAFGAGLDPLLTAAPAMALLAGTVLTLRLLPPLARLAERLAARGRGPVTALAAWQIARRPGRAAAPVLLLAPAVALGMLAIGQHASSQRSQDDRADFRAGTQIRVTAPSAAAPGTAEALAGVEGVRSVAPAARGALPMSGDRTATVLALDTREASATLRMRPDLSDGPAAARVAALAPRSAPAGPVVPGGSTGLRVTARLADATGSRAGSPADARPPRRGAGVTAAEASAVLTDAHGTVFRLPLGELPADARAHTLTAGLSGSGGAPGELTLTGVELVVAQPPSGARRHLLAVEEVHAVDPAGNDRRIDLAATWRAAADLAAADLAAADAPGGSAPARPKVLAAVPPVVEYGTGRAPSGAARSTMRLRLTVEQHTPKAVPGLATDRFLESSGARVGDTLDVALGSATVPVRVTAAVRALPTTGEGVEEGRTGGALLLDLGTVNRMLQDRDGSSLTPGEWWLDTAAGEAAGAAAGLRALPELRSGQVLVRDEVAAGLRGDPFGVGPAAALTAAAVAAVVLAGVGFAVGAVGSLRERRADLAVLRALGAPRRRLGRAVAVEQAVLVGLALAAGTALGVLLSRAVVPLTLVTAEATRPVPEPLVSLPPGPVALLLAAVAAVPLLTTVLLSRRRPSPAAALRDGGGH